MQAVSVILVNIALIIYTAAILGEIREKMIAPWYVILLCIGFMFDFSGTLIAYELMGNKIIINLHGILGYAALIFMFLNLIYTISILCKKEKVLKRGFCEFAAFSWIVGVTSIII